MAVSGVEESPSRWPPGSVDIRSIILVTVSVKISSNRAIPVTGRPMIPTTRRITPPNIHTGMARLTSRLDNGNSKGIEWKYNAVTGNVPSSAAIGSVTSPASLCNSRLRGVTIFSGRANTMIPITAATESCSPSLKMLNGLRATITRMAAQSELGGLEARPAASPKR